MSVKEDLLDFLDIETQTLNLEIPSEKLTANTLAEIFNIKRNTVSHYLNQLVEENRVIKINTRPVYFLSKGIFEKKYFHTTSNLFNSFQELMELRPKENDLPDVFDQLIGAEESLKKAIIQIKASIFYPGGLPIILSGPTGVGKSYTAELIHQFSIEKEILSKDAPFISLNCAQYADNPELLSSNLFGYVKGAFTGANANKEGMLAIADGGILFLDEVHRLNAEGQEKLFTFMDQGVYRRMGESEEVHKSNVRLIFATTEELEESFLQTFLRRIPIRVTIPSLDERGEREKKQFIYMFLIDESKKLHLPIRISERALDTLTEYKYIGNMGELKNTIKYIVASSFVKNADTSEVKISMKDLPDNILETSFRHKDTKIKRANDIVITEDSTLQQLYELSVSHMQLIKDFYERILNLFQESQMKKADKYFQKTIITEVNVLFDILVFRNTGDKASVLLEMITANVQEAIEHIEKSYHVKFNGNSIYAIAHFLYYKGNITVRWTRNQEQLIKKIANYLELYYKSEQNLVAQFTYILESKLDVKLDRIDEILLWVYLSSLEIDESTQKMKAVIGSWLCYC